MVIKGVSIDMQENQIIEYEEKLRKAMLASDVEVLNELIHDDLIFVNHFKMRCAIPAFGTI